MPKKVFISYRRDDTAAAAGRVYDQLSRLLSKPNVFFDVSTIGGGEDFVQRMSSEIGKSDAALVFIGDKGWTRPSQAVGRELAALMITCAPSCALLCPGRFSSCQCSWAAPACRRPSNCPKTLEPSRRKMLFRFATEFSTTARRTSWRRSWDAGVARQGISRQQNRLCRGRCARRFYAPASYRSLASLGAGAPAFSLDRCTSYDAHPFRRGDRGRLVGFALRSAQKETAVRPGSGVYGANTVCCSSIPLRANAPRLRSSCSDRRHWKDCDSNRLSPSLPQRSAMREARFTSWPMTV